VIIGKWPLGSSIGSTPRRSRATRRDHDGLTTGSFAPMIDSTRSPGGGAGDGSVWES
jgi:hypothetical protein